MQYLLVWISLLVISCSSSPACGDGHIDAEEECDGENLKDFTCEYFGFDSGELRCNNCWVDVSQCYLEEE